MSRPVYTALPHRAVITVTGDDAFHFLQGLITKDLTKFDSSPLLYACLLTAQGKFLYDFFIRKIDDGYSLDCEGGARAEALLKKLKMYKLRAKVDLTLDHSITVYQIFNGDYNGNALPDPRHTQAGYRTYNQPTDIDAVPFDVWDEYRIRLEIPDGSRDLIPEKSFIHEARLDEFGAVSYTKGCYVGQELVSRMHHRGLTKKILKCMDVATAPESTEFRSRCNGLGLALIHIATER